MPGDPPVPITVWHLSRPAAGTLVSVAMAGRLIANYTRPGAPVIDLTAGGHLHGLDAVPAALVITGPPAGDVTVVEQVAACAGALQPGGCLAVVIAAGETPDRLGPLVAAARTAGLTYLQHIVVAHQLTAPHDHRPDRAPDRARDRDRDQRERARTGEYGTGRGRPHLRVHTDVLIMRRKDATPGSRHE